MMNATIPASPCSPQTLSRKALETRPDDERDHSGFPLFPSNTQPKGIGDECRGRIPTARHARFPSNTQPKGIGDGHSLTMRCAVSFQVGSWFLGLRWLDTALDFSHPRALFPSQAPSSRSTPGHPHGHKTSWVTAGLGPSPTFSRLRVFACDLFSFCLPELVPKPHSLSQKAPEPTPATRSVCGYRSPSMAVNLPQWSICDRATMAPTSSLPQNDSISAVVL
jgi:hypothetical protein